jgi:multidrug resistance efflux pump
VLGGISLDDPAEIKLMSYPERLSGHVTGIGRGITIPNAQADFTGLATVNPVFTWVRLAQRVPVRIGFDSVPTSVRLDAGLTATVSIKGHGKLLCRLGRPWRVTCC